MLAVVQSEQAGILEALLKASELLGYILDEAVELVRGGLPFRIVDPFPDLAPLNRAILAKSEVISGLCDPGREVAKASGIVESSGEARDDII